MSDDQNILEKYPHIPIRSSAETHVMYSLSAYINQEVIEKKVKLYGLILICTDNLLKSYERKTKKKNNGCLT